METIIGMGTITGYARTATENLGTTTELPNLERQKAALIEAGCGTVFGEVGSGILPLHERLVLMGVIRDLHPGDTLIIYDRARLSRSIVEFCVILSNLQTRGVELSVLSDGLRVLSRGTESIDLASLVRDRSDLLAELRESAPVRPRGGSRPRSTTAS